MAVEWAAIPLLLPAACGCLWKLINLWQWNAPISQSRGIPHRAVGLSVVRLSIVLLRRHRFPMQFFQLFVCCRVYLEVPITILDFSSPKILSSGTIATLGDNLVVEIPV